MKVTQLTLNSKHQDELRQSGLTNFSSLAYFSADRNWTKEHIGYNLEGLVIPYLDHDGNPYRCSDGKEFYRIKPEWGNVKGDDKPKYLSRKNEGNRPYFPQSIDWFSVFQSRRIPIYFVEGEKKADRMAQAGYAAIGLTGVHGWLDSCPRPDEEALETTRVIPELRFLSDLGIFKGRDIPIVFDSDIVQKWQVKHALKTLASWVEEMGGDPSIVLLPTEPDRTKNGADDFIVRHGEAAFAELVYHAIPAFYRNKNGVRMFNLPGNPALETKLALTEAVLADRWKYRPNFGWYRWTGKCWQLCQDGTNTMISKDIYAVFDANKWQGQTRSTIQDVLSKLRPRLSADRGWNPHHLLAFSNGVLETSTQKFTPHSHHHLITSVLPFQYAPGLTCCKWLESLDQALAGDKNAIELVQAFFRWALTPKSTGKFAIECGWDLFGAPGTGKGTVLETLRNLVGRDNAGSFRPKYLGNANAAASMLDKKVSICSDSSGANDDPGLYNQIITNEPVPCKFLYKDIQHVTLNTFLVRAYNAIPPSPFGSQGLDRRIIAMAFNHQPKVRDITLQAQINAELSGIFNWAWSISEAEMVRRISTAGEIQAVKEASIQRFEENNPWFVFLHKSFPTETTIHPKLLYERYEKWSQEHGEFKLSYKKFTKAIEPFGVYQKETKNAGYKDYVIPAMDGFDIIAHLGINQGQNKPLTPRPPNNSPKPPNNSPKLPNNSPTENLESEPITAEIGELGEKLGEKPLVENPTLFDTEPYEQITISPQLIAEAGETGWDNLPLPRPPYIGRNIVETAIHFKTKARAVEWEYYLSIVCGVTAWKPKKVNQVGGKTLWQVRVTNITEEQQWDLGTIKRDESPPKSPLWKR
jgi:putative DNA primase/helicase